MPQYVREFTFKRATSYLIKKFRKLLKPKKAPRSSGYHRLISDEEQRSAIYCCVKCQCVLTKVFYRWLDEYAARASQLPSRIGIPYYDWSAVGAPESWTFRRYSARLSNVVMIQHKLFVAFTGFETKNKFTVKNSLGQKVYYAVEDNDCLTRNCCGPLRPFDMKILDNYRTEVMHLHRPLACDSCCFPCCLQV